MKPIIITVDEHNNIQLTKDELQKMIEDAYDDGRTDGYKNGYADGKSAYPYITYPYVYNTLPTTITSDGTHPWTINVTS